MNDHACESCFIEWQSIENVLVEFGEVETGMAGAGGWPLRSGVLEVRVTFDDGRVLTVGEPDGPFTFEGFGHLIRKPRTVCMVLFPSFDELMDGAAPIFEFYTSPEPDALRRTLEVASDRLA